MPTFRNTLSVPSSQAGRDETECSETSAYKIQTPNFICRRFETPCLFHLYRQVEMKQSVPKRRHIKFRRRILYADVSKLCLFHLHRKVEMKQSVPKRRHIKFIRRILYADVSKHCVCSIFTGR